MQVLYRTDATQTPHTWRTEAASPIEPLHAVVCALHEASASLLTHPLLAQYCSLFHVAKERQMRKNVWGPELPYNAMLEDYSRRLFVLYSDLSGLRKTIVLTKLLGRGIFPLMKF